MVQRFILDGDKVLISLGLLWPYYTSSISNNLIPIEIPNWKRNFLIGILVIGELEDVYGHKPKDIIGKRR